MARAPALSNCGCQITQLDQLDQKYQNPVDGPMGQRNPAPKGWLKHVETL